MDGDKLKQEAEFRLGTEVLAEIQQWYTETVEQPWDYVVHIVRRSYLLALMMEKITEVSMGDDSKFLTDAAFMLRCRKLADHYRRNQRFPSILLCDDILIHGRNINHFIEELENGLADCLSDYCTKDEVQQALVRALKIHVYVRADGPLLLLGRYELNLDYKRREEQAFWRKLSNDISSLIVYSGMANASYVYSDWITEKQFNKICTNEWMETTYQGMKQWTWVRLLGKPNKVKAIYTMRLISNRFGGYRLIPFVFLPNLSEKESHNLMWCIINKMKSEEFSEEERQWIGEWETQIGKRSFNELFTLIFSSTLLREYEKERDIQSDDNIVQERKWEIHKLVRNYNQCGWEATKEFISKMIFSELFGMEDLDRFLLDVISDERVMFSVRDDVARLTFEDRMEIIDKLEKYFYGQGQAEEIEACQLSAKPYSENKRRTKRTARGTCFLLNELAAGYNVEQAKYMMAYFLQMVDAGVLSLSSYAPSYVKVVGYAQFAKAGEQSLLLRVLKMFEYVPLLSKMQDYCEYEGKHILMGICEYAASSGCDLSDHAVDNLKDFVQTLETMGQKPADWNRNYLFKIDDQYHIQRQGMKNITEYIKKQNEHVRNYMNYLKGENPVY